MISYLLPTHNRAESVQGTLAAIGGLTASDHAAAGGAEVIVVDNASDPPVKVEQCLPNGLPVRVLPRPTNEGAAARNAGVHIAQGEWVVMLDDDSFPLDGGHVEVMLSAPPDVAAIGADITLPDGRRESGGLPEVFVGCGAAIRRDAFIRAGGFDSAFDYYAEEYDLCAKLILDGWRIAHDARFRVRHAKLGVGRWMDRIVHRLVRNNCWVMQRYAPASQRHAMIAECIRRYARIAMNEHAAAGFAHGMSELPETLAVQVRRPMSQPLFDRFTGLAHVRRALEADARLQTGGTVAVVDEGKNAWAIWWVLGELGIEILDRPEEAELLVIGTLSPGPMRDAIERWSGSLKPIIAPVSLGLAAAEVVERTLAANNSRSCPTHAPTRSRARLLG